MGEEERSAQLLKAMEQKLSAHLSYIDEQNAQRVRELEALQKEIAEAKMATPVSTRSSRSRQLFSEQSLPSVPSESTTAVEPPVPKLRYKTKKRSKPSPTITSSSEATPLTSILPKHVIPSDSELIFPDDKSDSVITNPMAYDAGAMTVLSNADVFSLRVHQVILAPGARKMLPGEVHTCYVDYRFLEGTHETSDCAVANPMEVHAKVA